MKLMANILLAELQMGLFPLGLSFKFQTSHHMQKALIFSVFVIRK
uniref:Uncharacterized protein n=1 Tax=Manihot esculenta TaxID=3983 RepID=A0A2C9U2P8_MANES